MKIPYIFQFWLAYLLILVNSIISFYHLLMQLVCIPLPVVDPYTKVYILLRKLVQGLKVYTVKDTVVENQN